MTDREFLEALHTQLSNHLVMPAAAQASVAPVASGGASGSIVKSGTNPDERSRKGHFGPGLTSFDLVGVKAGDTIRLEVAGATDAVNVTIYGPMGLQWAADPAPLIAGAGQVLPAPVAPMDGLYVVEVRSTTPGVIWWP